MGVAYESDAPPVPPPAGSCRLFRFVHSFAFLGIKKKKEEIVDETTVTKISFLLATSGLIKGSVPWLCFASRPL